MNGLVKTKMGSVLLGPVTGPGMPTTLRAPQPDREAAFFLRIASLFAGQSMSGLPVAKKRKVWSRAAITFGRQVPVASVVERRFMGPGGAITLRIYTPEGPSEQRPAFLWYHGGGFVLGDLDSNDSICRSVARSSGAVVVAVRYRLAPEYSLYAGREDCLAALHWVAANGPSIGVDPTRLAIGGDSAGGNLASAVAQENIRRIGPKVSLQVLVYPATDLVAEFPSKQENAHGYMLTAEELDSLPAVIDRGEDFADPWLSPGRSPDLHGLPPAVVLSAGFDPIRDDGLAYAMQLRAAGVPVELLHYPGQFHGFLNFDALMGAARDAQKRIGVSLARVFRQEPAPDCSVEITDRNVEGGPLSLKRSTEILTAVYMLTRSTRQVSSLAARRLSPKAANAAEFLLRPWWIPAAMVRRGLRVYLNAPTARQTYSHSPGIRS
ncbi:MAG: alpha/beta hydrolase [Gammaproteobacteria bacterium]